MNIFTRLDAIEKRMKAAPPPPGLDPTKPLSEQTDKALWAFLGFPGSLPPESEQDAILERIIQGGCP